MSHDWQPKAAAAKARTQARIPSPLCISASSLASRVIDLWKERAALSPLDREIIQLDATDLRDRLASRVYTALQVTQAYIKSASLAHQAVNCLTDFFPEEALERAKWLDQQYDINQGPVGPLHGVPISVKDQVDIAGKDSPAGFLSQVGKNIAEQDAHVIQILRAAGAVFYCKTTLPQAIMHLETNSYLGPTTNPYNRNTISAGGSSGGEGALIAMKGSPLGIGTDIGGSIRSPAAANGIYGFKPTAGILPLIGFRNHGCILGVDRIPPTQGPMGRSIRDLELYMQVVLAAEPWRRDPRPETPQKRTRIGWFIDDGVVTPTAPIRRGMEATLSALRSCTDVELVEFLPIEPEECWNLAASHNTITLRFVLVLNELEGKLYFCDGGQRLRAQCAASGEPVLDLSEWILSQAAPEPVTLQEYSALMLRRLELRNRVAAQWLSAEIDVLLCPAGASVAPKLNTARYWNYTSYWNLVNYPAMVIPTGLYVDGRIDNLDQSRTSFRNPQDEYNTKSFDLKASEGLPICVQLVGRIWQDQAVFSAANKVDSVLRHLTKR
ncbi:hypothetical protein QFC21_006458 [Naganishia friedmannii]|uniref:Uncharacterized protein n=1 Tax=Naganishia friedmannii TaxID=89922 RepID=A0ACC2V2F8_9TREE|nr:hypothetical protein QFC21_006458 [Naganishia friedmannii]